jgi:hypothetical protein
MSAASRASDKQNHGKGLSMDKAPRFRSRALTVLVAGALLALSMSSAARADFTMTGFGGSVERDGAFSRQAGSHVDLTTRLDFPTFTGSDSDEYVRSTDVELPPGVIADATAAPTCPFEKLVTIGNSEGATGSGGGWDTCPYDSRVGLVRIKAFSASQTNEGTAGIFNLPRPADKPALFGFNFISAVVIITPRVIADPSVPGGYRVMAHVGPISQGLAIETSEVTFARKTATAVPHPFMTNSTNCLPTPASTEATVSSWQHPDGFTSASFTADFDGIPFVNEGCERVPFDPSTSVQPTSHVAGAPTGLDVNITVPQSDAVDGLATAHVRKIVTTFPQGMGVSASAANGQGACSLAEIGLGNNNAPACPDSSKLGTVKVKTPVLDEELEGDVILAKQTENPFGSLLAMYLAVKGPGFYLKVPGKIDADPNTGQLTATFDNNPQLPFEELELSLRGGANAALVAPNACGTYSILTEITSWASSVPVVLNSPMAIDQGCNTGGFDPKLRAGTANPIGGKASPFNLQVTRNDGEQNISRIDATLPEGVLAKLAGVPLCGDAQTTTGSCPAGSQVGTTTVGVGAGTSPIYVPQPGKAPTAIYLAGPYKGAPYSLVVKVPAQAGPFDLGTVAVRSGIYIDPVTTRASVKSDPLPQILQGIPIAYRDIRVEVNRPDFTINPTSCDAMKVESTLTSTQGKSASPSARFQAAACGELAFRPQLALKLSGPTHRSAHPKLKATLTMPKGGANIGRAAVTLPKTEFLENAHIQTVCTRVQFAAKACPAKSVYGFAKAWSPLLDKPLQGPVYLRSSSHELPDLVASLEGQIHVDLAGRIDSKKARIRTTFDFVPDAPVSKFVLTMQGGKKGLLVNNTELCKTTPRADVAFDGQNGKSADLRPLAKTDCGKGRGK